MMRTRTAGTLPYQVRPVIVVVLFLAVWTYAGAGQPAYAQLAGEFPSARVKVWDTAVPVPPSLSLGLTPGESVEDPTGLTGHETSFPTVVTVYARGSHPSGPSGLSYWNPDGNIFVWYGKTVGFPGGVDINRMGPVQRAPSPLFGEVVFGPGDVWVGGDQFEPLYVHFAGTDRFRAYGTRSSLEPSASRVWGVKVDEKTGHVFVAQPAQGVITRLDPVTNDHATWAMGGGPAGITVDSQGRPYSTLSHADIILRIDPGPDGLLGTPDDLATFWRVPNLGGVRSFRDMPPPTLLQEEYPNGIITTDANGNIWFTESNSHEIGRLSAGPDGVLGSADDLICEYTKLGLANPQQIASTGSGSQLQVYFTEGEGNSTSILTESEADLTRVPVCTTMPAESLALRLTVAPTAFFDEEVSPLRTAIVPTVHDVPGMDGTPASGTTRTADGKLIPGILRYSPMPNPVLSSDGTPIGDAGNGFPTGMTGVYATNRVAGAYLKGNKHFELESGAVIAPPPGDQGMLMGRMTGGGRVFTADGTPVTHGFVLRCQPDLQKGKDVMQVNWGDGNRFHLESVASASCSDDPTITPNPPAAGFDTHSGTGTGRFNGVEGATVEWTFTDAGEPGTGDTAKIVIRDGFGMTVLEVSGTLTKGNHQAHKEPTK